jgi:hypothetical protein
MAMLGAGIGMVMQIMILATQNEAPVADLGVATSTITFFRAVGGSVGVALFGAVFNSRLTELLGGAAPTGLTPEDILRLPVAEQARTAGAFADAITLVFSYAVPVLVVGFLLTWLLREVPLRTASGAGQQADVDASAAAAVGSSAAGGAVDAPPVGADATPVGGEARDPAGVVDWGEPSRVEGNGNGHGRRNDAGNGVRPGAAAGAAGGGRGAGTSGG